MKLKTFALASAIIGLGLITSCSGGGRSDIKDYQNLSLLDSISFYFGEIQGVGYWQQAQMDSTLAGEKGKETYQKGLLEALQLLGTDPAYNQGVMTGVQVAMSMQQFKMQYGEELNKKLVMEGIRTSMRSNTSSMGEEISNSFNVLLTDFEARRASRIDKALRKSLDEFLASHKEFKKYGNKKIYTNVITPGTGAKVSMGDVLDVDMTMSTVAGTSREIVNTDELRVGQSFPANSPIGEVISEMKVGEEIEILAASNEAIGPNMAQYDVKETELVLVKIKLKGIKVVQKDEVDEQVKLRYKSRIK